MNGNSFCNVGVITLNDGNPGGITGTPATPYPSNIFVSGLVGTIQSITVDLNGLTHNRASDIDLLLVAPTGGKFLMMTGVGQFSLYSNTNLTLSDAAASALPQVGAIPSGTYRPASYELTNIFPAPAPASPYNQPATQGAATFASVFNGLDPNGTWSLYATDDTTNIIGSISKGWCLNINTPPPCTPPDISDEPDAVIVCAGSATSFTVAASGSGTLSYQWQEDGIDLTNTGVYSNVTTATLNISDVTGLNGKQYQVIITNDNGTSDDASDDCSSTSEEVMLTVFDPQAGTLSATNPVICAGETTTLNFTPTAGLTVVGWFLDDAAAGCNPTGSSLSTGTTFNVSPIGTTSYAVVVQNSDGCRDTACVTINVNPKPNITASATQTTICAGETTTLNFTPTTDLTVVGWFLDDDDAGCNPMGASLSTGTTFDVSPGVTTTYAVVVETDSGCRDTACVTITVNPLPTITLGANPVVCAGETSANLAFTATTGSPNQYSIDFADNSFADVTNGVLGSSPIVIAVPANAAVGTYNATLTVRNSTTTCGSQTYNISVRVLNCNIVVSDPCSCKNNATTLVNGQFNETVTIIAPSGQTWTVSAVNNLYQTTSPAPPAAPTLIAIGTAFTETPNGDGTSTYTLAGLTVDATSYSLSATNGIGTILSINNICYYPNPAITGLDPAYCADEPAVTLTGTIDRGDGQTAITPQSAVFDINGTVATQFDPQALGAGTYNVGFTVDAAAEGVTFPGCVQAVSQVVRVDPQVTVDAGTPQTICRTKTLALSALNPSVQYSGTVADLIYTWSFVEAGNNGTLTGTSSTDLNAGTYTPGPDAIARGYVTLRLTVDNPNDACEPVSDTVRVNILNVDCGKFPWNGN